jgi:hypothetical protein
MTKRISKEEKQRRWLELQKVRMNEMIYKEPVFDGFELKTPKLNPSYGDKPDE